MEKQGKEVRLPLVIFMLTLIIFLIIMVTALGIQNKNHKDTIKIYEEYYVLDEEMDVLHRQWRDWYQHFGEAEYYLRFHPEKYLRYLELKKIIGETEK